MNLSVSAPHVPSPVTRQLMSSRLSLEMFTIGVGDRFTDLARAGARYTDLLKANEAIVAKSVTESLCDRHLKPLFIG